MEGIINLESVFEDDQEAAESLQISEYAFEKAGFTL